MRIIYRFGKLGRLRYISHLDLQRFMMRALRRTDLPVSYSQGFNPHPQMSFASALALGMSFTLHQDSPVVPPNILLSVQNACLRRTMSGRILGAEQRISVREALRAVTYGAAYQIFEEDHKGSLAPGKLADFVLLSENPLTLSTEKLSEIRVLKTIKEDREIYRA